MGIKDDAEESATKARGIRKIIDPNVGAFHASVEERDTPELRDRANAACSRR